MSIQERMAEPPDMTEKRMPKQSLGQAKQSLGQTYGAYPSTCPNDYHVDEVKHGIRYIVGYKAACIIPQAEARATQ